MKHPFYILILSFLLLESCAQDSSHLNVQNNIEPVAVSEVQPEADEKYGTIDPSGKILETRILAPSDFQRTTAQNNSFAAYLRQLPLKPHGAEVMFYNGDYKSNYDVYDAVIDMEIGTKNLHQCADAIMRLWAEYLWNEKRYDEIHFNLTNGFRVDYSKWMEGNRVAINGNKAYWVNRAAPSNTYQDFWEYMELIFNYAGTLSLSKELVPVEFKDIQIGDVLIWGGSPGHAVLVIDMAENPKTEEKLFLLAQSYMPAQETQVLKNLNNTDISPWYAVSDIYYKISTPEWTFDTSDLKRFGK